MNQLQLITVLSQVTPIPRMCSPSFLCCIRRCKTLPLYPLSRYRAQSHPPLPTCIEKRAAEQFCTHFGKNDDSLEIYLQREDPHCACHRIPDRANALLDLSPFETSIAAFLADGCSKIFQKRRLSSAAPLHASHEHRVIVGSLFMDRIESMPDTMRLITNRGPPWPAVQLDTCQHAQHRTAHAQGSPRTCRPCTRPEIVSCATPGSNGCAAPWTAGSLAIAKG
jgi:hypothetical protein